MKWLDRLLHRGNEMPQEPPVREPDPELVDHAIKTTRALSKSDRVLERRRRLNDEITRVEQSLQAKGR